MRTKSDWLKTFKEQEESGLNTKEYCELHNINIATFKKMRWTFLKTSTIKETEDKIKVEPSTQDIEVAEKIKWSLVQTTPQTAEESLTIELGKFKIKVDEKSNLKNLKKVCEVLISLC